MPLLGASSIRPRRPALALVVLAACAGEEDCARLDGTARDQCVFRQVEALARADRAGEAPAALRSIETPMVRAAAIRALLAAAPQGLSMDELVVECGRLPGLEAEACVRAVRRPHLWTAPARPGP